MWYIYKKITAFLFHYSLFKWRYYSESVNVCRDKERNRSFGNTDMN